MIPAVEGYGSIESLVLVEAFSWSLSNAQGAFGTVPVIPESAGTAASFYFEIGATLDSAGSSESLSFVEALSLEDLSLPDEDLSFAKSADSVAPAVEASSEELAADELDATTSCVVLAVTLVPLLTVVVVLVFSELLEDEFDDIVSETVAASSSTTVSVVEFFDPVLLAEEVVFLAELVVSSALASVDEFFDVV